MWRGLHSPTENEAQAQRSKRKDNTSPCSSCSQVQCQISFLELCKTLCYPDFLLFDSTSSSWVSITCNQAILTNAVTLTAALYELFNKFGLFILLSFLFFSFFLFKILFLNNLYTHCGAWTYNPEIKSHMLYQLNQSGLLFSLLSKPLLCSCLHTSALGSSPFPPLMEAQSLPASSPSSTFPDYLGNLSILRTYIAFVLYICSLALSLSPN